MAPLKCAKYECRIFEGVQKSSVFQTREKRALINKADGALVYHQAGCGIFLGYNTSVTATALST